MKARKLDRQVQFQRSTFADDGFSSAETWFNDHRDNHGSKIWAEKRDLSDGERARAGIVEASLMTRFKVRWSAFTADLSPADRLVCEGVTFNITGIKEVEGRRQWLEITCAARAN